MCKTYALGIKDPKHAVHLVFHKSSNKECQVSVIKELISSFIQYYIWPVHYFFLKCHLYYYNNYLLMFAIVLTNLQPKARFIRIATSVKVIAGICRALKRSVNSLEFIHKNLLFHGIFSLTTQRLSFCHFLSDMLLTDRVLTGHSSNSSYICKRTWTSFWYLIPMLSRGQLDMWSVFYINVRQK